MDSTLRGKHVAIEYAIKKSAHIGNIIIFISINICPGVDSKISCLSILKSGTSSKFVVRPTSYSENLEYTTKLILKPLSLRQKVN